MKIVFLFLPLFLFADSFLSNYEYGKMLYHNPRGISCAKCHGENGEGSIIATYFDKKKGREERLIAPNIRIVDYKTFYIRLKYSKLFKNGKLRTVHYSAMPKYDYLVTSEINAIYNYLHNKGKK